MKIFLRAATAAQEAKDEHALLWFATTTLAGGDADFFHIVDGKNEGRGTALHQASEDNRVWDEGLQVARWLLKVNADVNAVEGKDHWTPLHIAADHGHAELIQELLDAMADPCARDVDGKTPLDLAKLHHEGRGVALFARGTPHLRQRVIMAALVACEGPETVEALEGWKKEAKMGPYAEGVAKPLERAHLRQRLRVILAPGYNTWDCDWCLFVCGEGEYATLKSQNIIAKPEVQASLWYLPPGLSAADACDADLLEALVKTTNEEVFQTDTVQAVVQAAWAQMRFSTAWEVVSCLLMVVLLCVASYTFRHELPQATASPT